MRRTIRKPQRNRVVITIRSTRSRRRRQKNFRWLRRVRLATAAPWRRRDLRKATYVIPPQGERVKFVSSCRHPAINRCNGKLLLCRKPDTRCCCAAEEPLHSLTHSHTHCLRVSTLYSLLRTHPRNCTSSSIHPRPHPHTALRSLAVAPWASMCRRAISLGPNRVLVCRGRKRFCAPKACCAQHLSCLGHIKASS